MDLGQEIVFAQTRAMVDLLESGTPPQAVKTLVLDNLVSMLSQRMITSTTKVQLQARLMIIHMELTR